MATRHPREVMPSSPSPCDGRLSPWADAGPARRDGRSLPGHAVWPWPWPPSFPAEPFTPTRKANGRPACRKAVLTVTALDADAGVLRCHLSAQP